MSKFYASESIEQKIASKGNLECMGLQTLKIDPSDPRERTSWLTPESGAEPKVNIRQQ